MNNSQEQIIEDICEYVNNYEIKQMLQEYMRRLIVNKPDDPIQYLIQTIAEDPYVSAHATNN